MRMLIIAVGRLRAGPESDMTADYIKRAESLGRTVGVNSIRTLELEESRSGTSTLRKAGEAKMIANAIPEKAFRVALDEQGHAETSEAFAASIQKRLHDGTPEIAYLIGGPDGHDLSTLMAADMKLSFGPMTWPHRLVRVMLAEQIYRAVTIMVNHPYHRP